MTARRCDFITTRGSRCKFRSMCRWEVRPGVWACSCRWHFPGRTAQRIRGAVLRRRAA